MGIYDKLCAIQDDLVAPKNNRNEFGKYNYRSCEDILKAVKPICREYKTVLYMSNEIELVGDRYYSVTTATLVDTETGEKLESRAHAREEAEKKGMDGSQISGASISYSRKYALAGLFDIDNEKDSDATNDHGMNKPKDQEKKTDKKPDKAAKTDKIDEIVLKAWEERFSKEPDCIELKAFVCNGFGIESLADMTKENAARLNGAWEKTLAAARSKK